MFIEEGMLIKATHDDGKTFTGTVYKIVVQPCKDDNNRPHALIFISQDKRFIEQEGEFGCASEWVDKLKSIEVLEKSTDTSESNAFTINFDDMIVDFIRGFDCDDYTSPACQKSLIITNQGLNGHDYWFGICCADGEPATKTRGIGACSQPLSSGSQEFIFSMPELLYRMDRLRQNHIQVIVNEAWWLNKTNQLGTDKQTAIEYPQTPTSAFFEEIINGTDFPNEKKVLYISKFDEEGNWTAFSCARDGEDNQVVYGGHIGLCSASGESYLTVYNLLYWLERFRVNGIEVIVDENWYQNLSMQKSLAPHTDYLDGAYYDAETQTATLGIEMFEEFRKYCVQEAAAYDVVKKTDKNVACSVKESVIDSFVKCMQSEKNETIRMLCMCPKEMLIDRVNGIPFEEPAEQWVERVDMKLIKEALARYDDREFAAERRRMSRFGEEV